MLLIHGRIGFFWDFHEVTIYRFHILQWLIKMVVYKDRGWIQYEDHRYLQWKTLRDSWMKQSNDNNALTDASFFVFLKDNSTFVSEQLMLSKNWWYEDVARAYISLADWSYLWFSNSLSVKLPVKKIPKNIPLSFQRQKRTQLFKKKNTGGNM